MDAKLLKDKRMELEATQQELANTLHVTVRQVINWEKGKYPVPYLVEHFVRQMCLNKLNKHIQSLNGSTSI